MIGSETDEVIKELFKSLLQRYQEGLQESMRGSEFDFDPVNALYYDLNKISLSRRNKYDKCVQYALTVALNHKKIKSHPEQIPNIRPFIDHNSWKEIGFPSNKKDWKKFESNNKSIVLNILYVPYNTKEIRHACKSKYNLKRENQVILLMITDGKKWHYLAVKSLPALLRGIRRILFFKLFLLI